MEVRLVRGFIQAMLDADRYAVDGSPLLPMTLVSHQFDVCRLGHNCNSRGLLVNVPSIDSVYPCFQR